MNSKDLMDTLGGVDATLLEEAENAGRMTEERKLAKRKRVLWFRLSAAVLCLTITLGTLGILRFWRNSQYPVMKNLWEKGDFTAYSLLYGQELTENKPVSEKAAGNAMFEFLGAKDMIDETQLSSETAAVPETGSIQSSPIKISNQTGIRVETIIAHRYAVCYDTFGSLILYDLTQDQTVDLAEKILGEKRADPTYFMQTAVAEADKLFPGMLSSEENRQMFEIAFFSYLLVDRSWNNISDLNAMPPVLDWEYRKDISEPISYENFLSLPQRDQYRYFIGDCFDIYVNTANLLKETDPEYLKIPYTVELCCMDQTNGVCIANRTTLDGNGGGYCVYDIRTDTVNLLDDDNCRYILYALENWWIELGATHINFSEDGKLLVLTTSGSEVSVGTSCDQGAPQHQLAYWYGMSSFAFTRYCGEKVCFLDLSLQKSSISTQYASTEAMLSESGSVVYYRKGLSDAYFKIIRVDENVWQNRLTYYPNEGEEWVFCRIKDGSIIGETVLEGEFIRFIANDSAVILRKNDVYVVYDLESGKDITAKMLRGLSGMMAHECLLLYNRNGMIYKKNLFQTEVADEELIRADEWAQSRDGAFIFAYCNGDSFLTCMNVVTKESCRVEITPELCSQLFKGENRQFRMTYNDYENTLVCSFREAENTQDNDNPVDFYKLLSELDNSGNSLQVYREITVNDEVLADFRRLAEEVREIGYATVYMKLPCGLNTGDSVETVWQKLALQEPEGARNLNGSEYILFESETEKLVLHYEPGWGLLSYQQPDSYYRGIWITYTVSGVPEIEICFQQSEI